MIQQSHSWAHIWENDNSKGYIHPNVYRSTIYSSQTCQQPKCPCTNEWITKMLYIYIVEYHSFLWKNEIMPFAATWMDLEMVILSAANQTKTNIILYHLYVESKKMVQRYLFIKQTHRHRKQSMVTKGEK